MINSILFDLDDTLIVELKSAEESFIETVSQIDYDIDTGEFLKCIREQAKELWYKLPTIDYCLKIGISSWEALWADFTGNDDHFKKLQDLAEYYRFETWNKTLIKLNINNPDIAFKLSNDFKRIRNTKHELYPDAKETLDILKQHYKLGLITNGAPDLQWKKIHGGNIENYFDCIAISGEYGYGKPDARLFQAVLDGLKAEKRNSIMVGNNLNSDIKGAQDIGIKTIWINRINGDSGNIRPDYTVDSLKRIYGIITA